MKTIPVSQVILRIASFLREKVNVDNILISGEVSNVRYVNGHCYFDLKDDQGQLSCTLWRTNAARIGIKLEDGMAILCHGTLNVYEKRASLQLNVDHIELDGLGKLYLQLEERKKRLQAEGLFDQSRKKSRPNEINTIGIVTGASTAALQDALKTIRNRWPMLRVKLFPASVQGEQAPPQIVKQLLAADKEGFDAVLLIRGGGSFEDLFCFNDEQIVRTLANMKTYTVTGIGHEIDTTLSDYAADHRALTPTAAAQWVTPDQKEVRAVLASLSRQLLDRARFVFDANAQRLLYLIDSSPLANPLSYAILRKERIEHNVERLITLMNYRMQQQNAILASLDEALKNGIKNDLTQNHLRIQNAKTALVYNSPNVRVQQERASIQSKAQTMQFQIEQLFRRTESQLEKQHSLLDALSWTKTLERGFSIVKSNGKVIKDVSTLKPDEKVELIFSNGEAIASIDKIMNKQ